MARLPRVILAGYPLHIMVRGNNSQEIFFSDDERKSYLEWLKDAARGYELAIHAFVLMPNHVHILATPKTPLSASRVMQSVEGVTPKYLIKLITVLEQFGRGDLSLH